MRVRIRADLLVTEFDAGTGIERPLPVIVDIEELLVVFRSVLKNYW